MDDLLDPPPENAAAVAAAEPAPEWLRVYQGEAAIDAFRRLYGEISNEIDRDGTERIANAIEDAGDLPEQGLLLEAYLAACLRRRATILGVDSEARVVLFPVILRAPAANGIPSYVGTFLADEIQSQIHAEILKIQLNHTCVIPMDRMYSSLQFDRESRELLQEMLRRTTENLSDTTPGKSAPTCITLGDDLDDVEDDEAFFAQGMVITFKLYPVVLVAPVGAALPGVLSDPAVLARIGQRLALCNTGQNHVDSVEAVLTSQEGGSTAADYASTSMVRVLGAQLPEHAELIARTMLSVEKLMLDASLTKLTSEKSEASAKITVNHEEDTVDVDWTVVDHEGRSGNKISISIAYGYTAHSLAARISAGFTALGYQEVVITSTDGMPVDFGATATLH